MKRIPFPENKADEYIKERGEKPCFICQIVAGESLRDRHQILFEDDLVIVFLSSMPTQLGQTLVCPKRHIEQIAEELSEEEYLHLQTIVHRFTKAIGKALVPERTYVASFGSQQMNRHVHFHIVPLPVGTPIREQQMASMMPELVGYLELEKEEWKELTTKIKEKL
jgi:histidine triad (HIT) family protein